MMKLFQGKTPTSSEIQQQIDQARQQRAELETRNAAIDDELAALYGVESPEVDTLESEHRANGDKLRRLELAIVKLHGEHKAAVLREATNDYRLARQAIVADVKALNAIKPKTDAARAKYEDVYQQERQLRARIMNAQHLWDLPPGITHEEWSVIRAQINAETPDADRSVALDPDQARRMHGYVAVQP